jgi:DNA-3-methyladenine glycosylase I
MHEEGETLAELVWSHAPPPRRRRPKVGADIPVTTPEAQALSKALRARGWRFVGPTIVYAFMQAVGVVDDHLEGCHRAV